MTSVAWTSTCGGMVRSRVWAVRRLITNLKHIGCSTGSSAGSVPFKIRSAHVNLAVLNGCNPPWPPSAGGRANAF
jgi:hypothetical protein